MGFCSREDSGTWWTSIWLPLVRHRALQAAKAEKGSEANSPLGQPALLAGIILTQPWHRSEGATGLCNAMRRNIFSLRAVQSAAGEMLIRQVVACDFSGWAVAV